MAAVLPEDRGSARAFNAGLMELGAVVCTARAPRCDECPLATSCRWLLAGRPASGAPRARRQPRFEGSDRQLRGRVLAELRATHRPIGKDELAAVVPDAAVRERILAGLLQDGLAQPLPGGWSLPLA
jgi:A/G-specific adenine glycosylase